MTESFAELFEQSQTALNKLKPGAIVSDVGSVKSEAARALHDAGDGRIHVIPGHPIAGAETVGPEAARADLYDGRNVILTPLEENSASARERLIAVWEACGARVMLMDPATHDEVLASVSHVPHFLSSVFMWQVASSANSDQRFALAGTGFRDFTRIAAGSAEVWRDIFLSNREAVLGQLQEVRQALDQAEPPAIAVDNTFANEDCTARPSSAHSLEVRWCGRLARGPSPRRCVGLMSMCSCFPELLRASRWVNVRVFPCAGTRVKATTAGEARPRPRW